MDCYLLPSVHNAERSGGRTRQHPAAFRPGGVKQNYFFFLGAFAPYLERPWLRLATPWASSVPRMMW